MLFALTHRVTFALMPWSRKNFTLATLFARAASQISPIALNRAVMYVATPLVTIIENLVPAGRVDVSMVMNQDRAVLCVHSRP